MALAGFFSFLVIIVVGPVSAALAVMGAALLQEQRWDTEDGASWPRRDKLIAWLGTAAAGAVALAVFIFFLWIMTAPG